MGRKLSADNRGAQGCEVSRLAQDRMVSNQRGDFVEAARAVLTTVDPQDGAEAIATLAKEGFTPPRGTPAAATPLGRMREEAA